MKKVAKESTGYKYFSRRSLITAAKETASWEEMKLPRRSPIRSSIPNISNLTDIFKDLFLENSCEFSGPKLNLGNFSGSLRKIQSLLFTAWYHDFHCFYFKTIRIWILHANTAHKRKKEKPFPKQQPARLSRNGHNIMLCFQHCTLLQKRGCDLPGHMTNNWWKSNLYLWFDRVTRDYHLK